MEIKRCVRCGRFFETAIEVCNNCLEKDNKELGKLKSYLSEYDFSEEITRQDVSATTGITMKNLNRFLQTEEFAQIQIPQEIESKTKKVTSSKKLNAIL